MTPRVGMKLYGYCGGAFSDSYQDKRIEAIGEDWIVAREISSERVLFESFSNHEELEALVEEYGVKSDEDA